MFFQTVYRSDSRNNRRQGKSLWIFWENKTTLKYVPKKEKLWKSKLFFNVKINFLLPFLIKSCLLLKEVRLIWFRFSKKVKCLLQWTPKNRSIKKTQQKAIFAVFKRHTAYILIIIGVWKKACLYTKVEILTLRPKR